MSDCHFVKLEIDGFLKTHPQEEGWKVYQCYEHVIQSLSLDLLLDFLRDECPFALRHRLTMNEVNGKDLLGLPFETREIVAGSAGDLQQECNAKSWSGDIEIEWRSQSLHFYSFCLRMYNPTTVIFMATTSNSNLRDFLRALRDYERARRKARRLIYGLNGSDLLVPPVAWEDVILPLGQAEAIRGNVEAFFHNRDRYRQLGIPYRRGLLFVGPPGCGKTLTIKAIANSIQATFLVVYGKADVGDELIEHAFALGRENSPAVILLEDVDKLMKSERCSLSYFLNLLDGLSVAEGIMVIGTANNPEKLDPALLHRPSRFDRIWSFPLPNESQRLALLQKRGGAFFSGTVLREIAVKSRGFTMAYVQEIVVNALLDATHSGETVTERHLYRSLETLKAQRRSVSKEHQSVEELGSIGFAHSGMINV